MKKKASNKKHYSIQEANAALPLVRAIVADIVALAAEMREHYASIEQVPRNDAGEFLTPDADVADGALQALRDGNEKMKEYVRELGKLGIELKDFHIGLVDFRAMLEGREVYLCWKLGEPEVAYWHELNSGYSGRQRLVRINAPALAKGGK